MKTNKTKKKKEVSSNVKTSTTLTTLTTLQQQYNHRRVKTQMWGFLDEQKKVFCYQITPKEYLVNANGNKELVKITVAGDEEDKKTTHNCLLITCDKETLLYVLPQTIRSIRKKFYVPSLLDVEDYINGDYDEIDVEVLYVEFEKLVGALLDFRRKEDLVMLFLYTIQANLRELMDSFFFLGLAGTKESAKTTIQEILVHLIRGSKASGEISTSSIARNVEPFNIVWLLDEFDESVNSGNPREDSRVSILRKAQRRGATYDRTNKNTHELESFEVANPHAYAIRSTSEDAFLSRTLILSTIRSKDYKLPVLNKFKDQVLRYHRLRWWFWGFSNVVTLLTKANKIKQSVVGVVGVEGYIDTEVNTIRTKIYDNATSIFDKKSKSILESLSGRDAEIGYDLLYLNKLIGRDDTDVIRLFLREKQENQSLADDFAMETLRSVLLKSLTWCEDQRRTLGSTATFSGSYFYPKRLVFKTLCDELWNSRQKSVNSQEFTRMLYDVGFTNSTITNQRFDGNPEACLIFTPDIVTKLRGQNLKAKKVLVSGWSKYADKDGKVSKNNLLDGLLEGVANKELFLDDLVSAGVLSEVKPELYSLDEAKL